MGESNLQAKCFQWHWNSFPKERRMLFHVNNKAKNAIEGSRFKAMGVVKGPSDFIYISRKVNFIELKTEEKGSRQSNEQLDFEQKVKALGHDYYIVKTLEQFQSLILKLQEDEKGSNSN